MTSARRSKPVEVIHGVSIDIADGDFVVLVGPSGCGKSTLLRMIAGLESVTGGQVAIGDKVVNQPAARRTRHRHGVPELCALSAQDGGAEHGLRPETQAHRSREIEERVGKAADILGLKPYLHRYPRQLSGGQRQRVAMGRAIVRDPQVFLFDEPLSNLDAKLRVQMRTEIKELHQRLKTTTVYVTHDQVEAMTMADKIVVMQDGRVEQVGAPLELFDRPTNLFVAGFIGSPSMNILNGTVAGGDKPAVSLEGVTLPVAGRHAVSDGQPVMLRHPARASRTGLRRVSRADFGGRADRLGNHGFPARRRKQAGGAVSRAA